MARLFSPGSNISNIYKYIYLPYILLIYPHHWIPVYLSKGRFKNNNAKKKPGEIKCVYENRARCIEYLEQPRSWHENSYTDLNLNDLNLCNYVKFDKISIFFPWIKLFGLICFADYYIWFADWCTSWKRIFIKVVFFV